MIRRSRIARGIALGLALLWLGTAPAGAATAVFQVSLQIREAVQIESGGEVAAFPAERLLGIPKPRSLVVETLTCLRCADNAPEVSFAEPFAMLVGPDGGRVQVELFVVQRTEKDTRRLFVGGFLQEGHPAPDGVYRGTATVNILYQ